MREPLVSIITPSYNRKNFIELNIQSIMNQTYKNIEHIIIDGASNDGTIDILKKYEGKYNMRWISEIDEGMYHAINKGIKMAKGEIIAYLNTDDLYFPYSIEIIVNEFINSCPDIVYGDCLLIDIRKRLISIYLQPSFNALDFACADGGCLAQPSVFLRKSVFYEIGLFNTNLKLLADCEYWVRAFVNNKNFRKIDEFLSIVIWHGSNLVFDRESAMKDKRYIKNKYCHNKNGNIKFINFLRKYKSQMIYRLMLIRFMCFYLIKKGDKWRYFFLTIKKINIINFLLEFLPNRYKLNMKDNVYRYIQFKEPFLKFIINKLFGKVHL